MIRLTPSSVDVSIGENLRGVIYKTRVPDALFRSLAIGRRLNVRVINTSPDGYQRIGLEVVV